MKRVFAKITNIKRKNCFYLDANFLVYWVIAKDPTLRANARRFLAQALVRRSKFYSSALSFDEAWWNIKNEINAQNGNVGGNSLPCWDAGIFPSLEKLKTLLLPKLKLTNCAHKKQIEDALSFVSNHQLQPRDAFHLAMMRHCGIDQIVTNDSGFINKAQQLGIIVQSL